MKKELFVYLFANSMNDLYLLQLKLGEMLGNGQFGIVHMGLWSTAVSSEPIQVAVKSTRPDANNQERQMLEDEVEDSPRTFAPRAVLSLDHS